MRRPLLRLALLAGTILSLCGWVSGGTQYSGITSMTFQNGVAPTSGYTGCVDTYIRPGTASADTGKNYGASDSLKLSGPSATTTGENRILISFDISALPDSAIITKAQLWLYQVAPSGGTVALNDTSVAYVNRVMNSWTVGTGTDGSPTTPPHATACWNRRKGQQGAKWVNAGCKASNSSNGGLSPWFPGTSLTVRDTTTISPPTFVGADTVYDGVNSIASILDIPAAASTRFHPKVGATTVRRIGWAICDVTHQVSLWHIGANANNGFVLSINAPSTLTTQFSFISSNAAGFGLYRHPKLVVYYFDPTSGSSGSGGRRVIGNGPGGLH